MNKKYRIDIREVPVKEKKKETSTTQPFSFKMFILAVIVSIFLFPNMWWKSTLGDNEGRINNYKTNYPFITKHK
jgi:hypothetical protein